MIPSDLPSLARAIAENFARLENPDDPQLDAYGDLQALIAAGLLAALQDQHVQMEELQAAFPAFADTIKTQGKALAAAEASLLVLTTALAEEKRLREQNNTLILRLGHEASEAKDDVDDAKARVAELEADLADLRRQLQTYGSCTLECARRRCIHCDKRDWMHDLTEDLDEVTCLFQGLTFTPKPCDCGFTAALSSEAVK